MFFILSPLHIPGEVGVNFPRRPEGNPDPPGFPAGVISVYSRLALPPYPRADTEASAAGRGGVMATGFAGTD